MKKSLSLLLIFVVSFLYSQNDYIRIHQPPPELIEFVKAQNTGFYHDFNQDTLDMFWDREMLSELDFEGLSYEILQTAEEMSRNLEGYRTYPELLGELNAIATDPDYEEITHLYSLGKSQGYLYYEEGNDNYEDYQHEIWCLKLSDNPDQNEDEPNVFFGSEIHARETISLEVDMHILYYLLESYGVVDSVNYWIDNTQIWFIPLINPDGHKLTIEELHTMHRKNIRDNDMDGNVDYSSVDGVDLNRNFDYTWDGPYSSTNYTSQSYRGPLPWSEPESVYLRDLLQDHKFYAGITYHSYGEKVLYPLGNYRQSNYPDSCNVPDSLAMDELAEKMAYATPKLSGFHYQYEQANINYPGSGTMGDWGYGVERIFSFTVELATTFYPPAYQIDQICEDNLQGALLMLDRVHYATVTGSIEDIEGNPLVAEVYVEETDFFENVADIAPVRSGNTYGRYYRLLLPGNYTFIFSCPGYDDITIENVPVLEDEVTELDIVFGSEFVTDVKIEVDADVVTLGWEQETGYDYKVYSSDDPNGEFDLDESGSFTGPGSWESGLVFEKRFYRIKKIPL